MCSSTHTASKSSQNMCEAARLCDVQLPQMHSPNTCLRTRHEAPSPCTCTACCGTRHASQPACPAGAQKQPSPRKCKAGRGPQPRTACHHTSQPEDLPIVLACKEADVGRVRHYDVVLKTLIQVSILHNQDFRTFWAQRPVGKGALTAVRLQQEGSACYKLHMLGQTSAELPASWGLVAAMGCSSSCTEGGCCRANAVHGCSSQQATQDTPKELGLAIFRAHLLAWRHTAKHTAVQSL